MEDIEMNQYNKSTWSTCIRTTLNSNGWGIAWHLNLDMLNIEQFRSTKSPHTQHTTRR